MSANKRFDLADMSDDEVQIPKTEMISRVEKPGKEEKGSDNVQAIAPPTPASFTTSNTTPAVIQHLKSELTDDSKVMELATTDFVPAEARIKTSMSLPNSLDQLLNKKVYDLRMKGFKKITREAVVEDALSRYFGVKK